MQQATGYQTAQQSGCGREGGRMASGTLFSVDSWIASSDDRRYVAILWDLKRTRGQSSQGAIISLAKANPYGGCNVQVG